MEAAASGVSARRATAVPRKDVALSAIAAVSWALTGMAGTAALGLRLPSATTAGDVSAFSLKGADLHTTVEITPLGGSLVSALLFSWFFLRFLRTAGVVVAPAELLTHAGTVVVLLAPLPAGRGVAREVVQRASAVSMARADRCRNGSGPSSTPRPQSASPWTRWPHPSTVRAGVPAAC